jgi:hypothetical protein
LFFEDISDNGCTAYTLFSKIASSAPLFRLSVPAIFTTSFRRDILSILNYGLCVNTKNSATCGGCTIIMKICRLKEMDYIQVEARPSNTVGLKGLNRKGGGNGTGGYRFPVFVLTFDPTPHIEIA